MTKKVTMQVGRKLNPDKMKPKTYRLEPDLIKAMSLQVKGNISAWVRARLWEAVNK